MTLSPDVAAIIEHEQRARGEGVSAVVNDLVRRGARARTAGAGAAYTPRTHAIGVRVDVTDVQAALDVLEGPDRQR